MRHLAALLILGFAPGCSARPPAAQRVDAVPASVVQLFVDAANDRDAGAMAELVSEDAVFARFPAGTPLATGRGEIHAFYARLLPTLPPTLRIRVEPRIVEGAFVIDQEHFSPALPRGASTATWIYQIRDGLIHRAWLLDEPR